ncbi:hypothetical protein AAMO2058_001104600 [Amorphochlora amoebiformis]
MAPSWVGLGLVLALMGPIKALRRSSSGSGIDYVKQGEGEEVLRAPSIEGEVLFSVESGESLLHFKSERSDREKMRHHRRNAKKKRRYVMNLQKKGGREMRRGSATEPRDRNEHESTRTGDANGTQLSNNLPSSEPGINSNAESNSNGGENTQTRRDPPRVQADQPPHESPPSNIKPNTEINEATDSRSASEDTALAALNQKEGVSPLRPREVNEVIEKIQNSNQGYSDSHYWRLILYATVLFVVAFVAPCCLYLFFTYCKAPRVNKYDSQGLDVKHLDIRKKFKLPSEKY